MRIRSLLIAHALLACAPVLARAQGPPPRIGPFVVDLRMSVPKFPRMAGLAQSRGLNEADLPGTGLGVDLNAHVYPLTWKRITIGLGGQVSLARAHASGTGGAVAPGGFTQPAVTETFTSFSPQLSLNFGNGDGWSYLSGGIGSSRWSIVPEGAEPQGADLAWVRTMNYGGGARWFMRRRVAFHVDIRFHQVEPGPAHGVLPGAPRVQMLVLGAGISVK